jgi:hypothetical protein
MSSTSRLARSPMAWTHSWHCPRSVCAVAFDVHAVDYLLKPIAHRRFQESPRRARADVIAGADEVSGWRASRQPPGTRRRRTGGRQERPECAWAHSEIEQPAPAGQLWLPARESLSFPLSIFGQRVNDPGAPEPLAHRSQFDMPPSVPSPPRCGGPLRQPPGLTPSTVDSSRNVRRRRRPWPDH